jgi:hypothetical protein
VRNRGIVAIALLGGWALLGLGIYPNERLDLNLFGVYMTAACLLLMIYASNWNPHRNPAPVAVEASLLRGEGTGRARLARRRPVGAVARPLEAD